MLEPTIEWERSVATLIVDGHPQSAVDVDDPTNVVFEYVRGFVLALTVLAPEGPLRVTHVGGAGMTLARWVQATRPGSPQIVTGSGSGPRPGRSGSRPWRPSPPMSSSSMRMPRAESRRR